MNTSAASSHGTATRSSGSSRGSSAKRGKPGIGAEESCESVQPSLKAKASDELPLLPHEREFPYIQHDNLAYIFFPGKGKRSGLFRVRVTPERTGILSYELMGVHPSESHGTCRHTDPLLFSTQDMIVLCRSACYNMRGLKDLKDCVGMVCPDSARVRLERLLEIISIAEKHVEGNKHDFSDEFLQAVRDAEFNSR